MEDGRLVCKEDYETAKQNGRVEQCILALIKWDRFYDHGVSSPVQVGEDLLTEVNEGYFWHKLCERGQNWITFIFRPLIDHQLLN